MSKTEHGSIGSYITGFVLSIVFTLIPYYVVVHKTFAGTQLLVIILGLAIIQMLIQIFFFLHLGRGPKPFYNIVFFVSTVGIIAVVVGGSLFIMSHLHYNMSPTEANKQLAEKEGIYQVEGTKTGACESIKANHQIIISNGTPEPRKVQAELCDTLSFTNKDSVTREVSFGTATMPVTYAGETEISVRKGKSETITLNQEGTYSYFITMEEHGGHKLKGSFTVSPN